MLTVRHAADRGATRLGWLDSRHTFSFGDYVDPAHHHFRALRVINDDTVAGGGGFGTHGHRDMEILTYVLSGRLEHKDSMGHGSVLGPGRWQKMSAGTGVLHSEVNASPTDPVHFLQMWVLPDRRGLPPGYAEADVPAADKAGRWAVVAAPPGEGGRLPIHQDVTLSVAAVGPADRLGYDFAAGRFGWLQVAAGRVTANGLPLAAGDGLRIEGEPRLVLEGTADPADVLLFDLG